MTSEKVSDFCHVHRHLVRFAFCKLLEELVLPEMPSAPPESDYGDDNETMRQGKDTTSVRGREGLHSAQ